MTNLKNLSEEEKAIVEAVEYILGHAPTRGCVIATPDVSTLLTIIHSLDKRLTEIREAARPIIKKLPEWDDMGIRDDYKLSRLDIEVSDLRKLFEVLGRTR